MKWFQKKKKNKYYEVKQILQRCGYRGDEIKKKKLIIINYYIIVYNHVICTWLEDNMISRVISKNVVMSWIPITHTLT